MRLTDVTETRFTIRDYERLPEDLRCQLIEGQLVKEPAPTFGHQSIVSRLIGLLDRGLVTGSAVPSPIDVVLDDFSILQPDVAIWRTAPDKDVQWVPTPTVVIEVLSPSTEHRDREQKTRLYLAAGVAEVWLIQPTTGVIEVHTNARVTAHAPDETVTSAAIPELSTSGRDLAR